jgi:hypothetical protein
MGESWHRRFGSINHPEKNMVDQFCIPGGFTGCGVPSPSAAG